MTIVADYAILPQMDDALVVFTNECDHWLARWLKPGYRHVFCVVPSPNDDGTSVVINYTLLGIKVTPVQGTPRQLATHYRDQGLDAIVVPYKPWKRSLLPMTLNSCVGYTKQALGIQSWARTPWQLRKLLSKDEEPVFYHAAT